MGFILPTFNYTTVVQNPSAHVVGALGPAAAQSWGPPQKPWPRHAEGGWQGAALKRKSPKSFGSGKSETAGLGLLREGAWGETWQELAQRERGEQRNKRRWLPSTQLPAQASAFPPERHRRSQGGNAGVLRRLDGRRCRRKRCLPRDEPGGSAGDARLLPGCSGCSAVINETPAGRDPPVPVSPAPPGDWTAGGAAAAPGRRGGRCPGKWGSRPREGGIAAGGGRPGGAALPGTSGVKDEP